jgi:Mrp family chromosome partitioning ATPase
MAAHCDAVILVLPWGETPFSAVAEAATVVQEAGGTVAGVVLADTNRDPATEIAVQNTRGNRAATSRAAMFGGI